MKNLLIILILAIFSTAICMSQEAVTATGGEASGSNGTVSYTVGQVGYSVKTGGGGSVLEGVQQPYEIFIVGVDEEQSDMLLKAFPNPVNDYLTLILENKLSDKMSYQLFNLQGKLIKESPVSDRETKIETGKLTAGTYFLKVSRNNEIVKVFKIVKN